MTQDAEQRILTEDAEILQQAERWSCDGRAVALATVVKTFGSAPRPVGAHLVVDESGAFFGSVSAGCVEGDVIAAALEVIADGAPRLLELGVADELAWRAGLSCGGHISVHVQKLNADGARLLQTSNRLNAARKRHAIATALEDGATRLIAQDDVLAPHARESQIVVHGGQRWFVEARLPAPRLVVIGAVHVAQALAPMARIAGFEVVVVDPRLAYASVERFPGICLDTRWPDEALNDLGLDASTALVVLTHDPKIDDPALKIALESSCFYIGALGSRATHARRVERLVSGGVAREALARISAPIGLDIGALSPADIAVSIVGELVLQRRRKPLRDVTSERTT